MDFVWRSRVMSLLKKSLTYLVICAVALLEALNYELFVFPNQFAPSGLNGICTMVQYVSGISVGYLSLLINIPLALWVYKSVSKPLALRSMVYVVFFSVGLLVFDHVDLSAFAYSTDTGTSKILGPLVAGIIMGFGYSVLVRSSAYSGGTDFISALIHNRYPDKSFFGMSFTINACIAIASFFVYDYQMEPVILCILYSFTSTTVGERLMKSGRSAVRFEIVTDQPRELARQIIDKFHHSATLIPAKGMYSGRETNVLVCVVNKTQAAALAAIIHQSPHAFAVMSQVGQVVGNFKHLSREGKEVAELLDCGDGKTL